MKPILFEQDGYGGVPGVVHTLRMDTVIRVLYTPSVWIPSSFMCHKYRVTFFF